MSNPKIIECEESYIKRLMHNRDEAWANNRKLQSKITTLESQIEGLRMALTHVWDTGEMGFLYDGADYSCGDCNSSYAKSKDLVVHEDYCSAGIIFKALATLGKEKG